MFFNISRNYYYFYDIPNCRFVLHLMRSEPLAQGLAELCLVETNPFKHLTHLALKLQPGNDTDVKKYLATCLKSLQVGMADPLSHLAVAQLQTLPDSAESSLEINQCFYAQGPIFLELLSTKVCLAWNFCLDKYSITSQMFTWFSG